MSSRALILILAATVAASTCAVPAAAGSSGDQAAEVAKKKKKKKKKKIAPTGPVGIQGPAGPLGPINPNADTLDNLNSTDFMQGVSLTVARHMTNVPDGTGNLLSLPGVGTLTYECEAGIRFDFDYVNGGAVAQHVWREEPNLFEHTDVNVGGTGPAGGGSPDALTISVGGLTTAATIRASGLADAGSCRFAAQATISYDAL